MRGYLDRPEETAKVLTEDGWFATGDVACMDERGFFKIVDRKKDMIVSGGFNVYPNEVENALYHHPSVFEACVVGAPDPDMGEVVQAVVVLKEGHEGNADALIEHCANELGKFKKPHAVDFVSELPKNNTGKIQRRDVRAEYWKGQDRQV